MKYTTASIIALVGAVNALPHPTLPEPSLPSFSFASEAPALGSSTSSTASGQGSGDLGLPSLPMPSGGLGGLLGGGSSGGLLGGGSGSFPLPTGGLGGLLGGGSSGGLGGLLGGGSGSLPLPTSGSGGLGGLLGGGSSSGLGGLLGGGSSSGSSGGSGLGSLLGGGGLSGGSGLSGLLGGLGGSSNVQVTSTAPTATATGTVPTSTGSTGGNAGANANNGESCASGSGGSENGVKGGKCCTDMTVIFARGTGEPGNMGIISGPPMVKAIRSKLGAAKVTVQGVDYAASAAGNANMGADGGKVMAQYVEQALKQCPGTKIIVSGYSQGGMVVHNAFSNGASASNVAGAVMFGDPLKRQSLPGLSADKVKQFCGTSDMICGGGGDGGATGSHLSYGSVADSAATFAIQAAGLA